MQIFESQIKEQDGNLNYDRAEAIARQYSKPLSLDDSALSQEEKRLRQFSNQAMQISRKIQFKVGASPSLHSRWTRRSEGTSTRRWIRSLRPVAKRPTPTRRSLTSSNHCRRKTRTFCFASCRAMRRAARCWWHVEQGSGSIGTSTSTTPVDLATLTAPIAPTALISSLATSCTVSPLLASECKNISIRLHHTSPLCWNKQGGLL